MADLLPKTARSFIAGGLYRQKVKCGKSNCRCAAGDLHEGYFYILRRLNGKLVKTYVRKADVPRVRAIIEAVRDRRDLDRRLQKANRAALASARTRLRSVARKIQELRRSLNPDVQAKEIHRHQATPVRTRRPAK